MTDMKMRVIGESPMTPQEIEKEIATRRAMRTGMKWSHRLTFWSMDREYIKSLKAGNSPRLAEAEAGHRHGLWVGIILGVLGACFVGGMVGWTIGLLEVLGALETGMVLLGWLLIAFFASERVRRKAWPLFKKTFRRLFRKKKEVADV